LDTCYKYGSLGVSSGERRERRFSSGHVDGGWQRRVWWRRASRSWGFWISAKGHSWNCVCTHACEWTSFLSKVHSRRD